mmetsp:Transcript_10744/g.19874  ORF Transcript_10744/g.19874 Transcript_10744/m.19874 type:complete len:274 (-) Transcript_10744:1053-1874(-)
MNGRSGWWTLATYHFATACCARLNSSARGGGRGAIPEVLRPVDVLEAAAAGGKGIGPQHRLEPCDIAGTTATVMRRGGQYDDRRASCAADVLDCSASGGNSLVKRTSQAPVSNKSTDAGAVKALARPCGCALGTEEALGCGSERVLGSGGICGELLRVIDLAALPLLPPAGALASDPTAVPLLPAAGASGLDSARVPLLLAGSGFMSAVSSFPTDSDAFSALMSKVILLLLTPVAFSTPSCGSAASDIFLRASKACSSWPMVCAFSRPPPPAR